MSRTTWISVINKALVTVIAVAGLSFGASQLMSVAIAAEHKMNENDMALPIDDPKVVDLGREKYAQRCSFCHGAGGKGAKGPCLACGRFRYTGNTNSEIYATIAGGINNRALGGTMGAFGTTMSAEEIMAVVTFLRFEEKRRIAAGEIPDPTKE